VAHLPDLPLRDEHAAAVPLLSMHTIASVNVIGHSSLSLDDCKATGDDRGVTEKVKSRKRLSKAEQRAETMEQILDAAEDLFSKHGLHGVALKDVAKRVGVHHTLLNYYFTDKKALFDAVFARRAAVTSQRRIKALDDYETASAGKPTIEGALHTFLDTDLDLYIKGGEGWRNYGQLSAQVANTPKWGASLMDEHFDPVVLKLIGLLQKALPNCAPEDIFWGYHFVSGALMLTLARTGRIDKLSDGLCKSDDYAAVKERMASFMAAGFRAICEQCGREREEGSQARTS
jgi:AcrR family transcriptional regulator